MTTGNLDTKTNDHILEYNRQTQYTQTQMI